MSNDEKTNCNVDDYKSNSKHYLFNLIESYIKECKKLSFQELKSDESILKIKHISPEPSKVTIDSEMEFKQNNESYSHITMNLGGIDTKMIYVGDYDIYIGYKEINKVTYQLIIQGIELGEQYLLEISYHNLNEPKGLDVGHDGTIHPTEILN